MRTHALAIALSLVFGTGAIAQETAPPEETQEESPPESDDQPTLDELLGLEEGEEDAGDVEDTTERELDRKLSGEEAAEAFREAARLMGEAAERVNTGRDVGIDTQRLQEDIIRRLEMIIESAPRQQSQSQSQSQSQQQQNQDQQQPQQQRQNQNDQAGQGDNRAERTPPGRQEGELGAQPALGSALWGALPQRVREAISQGTSDDFSALYEGLTEAYYRRLAEEADQ